MGTNKPVLLNNRKIGRNLASPFLFRKKKNRSVSKAGKYLVLGSILSGIIVLIYFFYFSGYFVITEIIITNEAPENAAMSAKIKQKLQSELNKSTISVETDELQAKILNNYPELETISVNKDYPGTIKVEFAEYPIIANVINESTNLKKSYIINSIGFAVKEDLQDPSLPFIKVKSDEPINTQKAVLEKAKIDYILESKTYFEEKLGMKVKEILYKPAARELHLLTERDFYIWLDMQKSYEEQFQKLKKAMVKLDIYKENLQYIDLRIAGGTGDKIIYKRK